MIWGLARLELEKETTALQRLEKRALALLQQRGHGGGAPSQRQVPPWGAPARQNARPSQSFKAEEVSMSLWGLAALKRSPPTALLKLMLKEVVLQVSPSLTHHWQ